jgi:hypothetical protein
VQQFQVSFEPGNCRFSLEGALLSSGKSRDSPPPENKPFTFR